MPDTLRRLTAFDLDPGQDGCRGQCAGLTVADAARRYRVSPDKIRAWIARGELRAINAASTLSGKPRWVITQEALSAFEQRRLGGPALKPQRRRRSPTIIDFYPD